MTENDKWAVSLHREGDASTTVGYEGPDEESARNFVAEELDLNVDDEGEVTGDPQITHISVEADPDIPVQLEEHEEQ